MTRRTQDLMKVQSRRKEISFALKALQQEDTELAVAEKVLLRMSGVEETYTPLLETQDVKKKRNRGEKSVGSYILQVLSEKDPNKSGMTAPAILEIIQQNWIENLKRTSFSPPLFRLKDDNQIIKDGNLYRLP